MKQFIDFALSETGYNHEKVGKVCQDSSGRRSTMNGTISIIAVADGHGSDNYPRTDRGSSFAVDAAIDAICEFVAEAGKERIDIYAEHKTRLPDLAANILRRWYKEVNRDIGKYPFDEEDLQKVSDRYRAYYSSGQRCEKAYGTTLIAVCVTPECWFGLQIGDGKCVLLDQDGQCNEPIPWDENCQANITTSLCDSDAIDEFRFFCSWELPLGIFIGSDGIDDSYASDEELYDLYRTIWCLFVEQGEKAGRNEVKDFLPKTSKKGSGDDMSIAGIICTDISDSTIRFIAAQRDYNIAERTVKRLENEYAVAKENVDYVSQAIQKANSTIRDAQERQAQANAELERIVNALNRARQKMIDQEQQLEKCKQLYTKIRTPKLPVRD